MDYDTRIEQLERLVAELSEQQKKDRLEIERAQAAAEVQTLMGKYALYYSAQQYYKCAELWAKRDDSSVDVGGGACIGYEDAVAHDYSKDRIDPDGRLRVHTFSSPAVEVAADCKTARGTWISPGIDTDVNEDGTMKCEWCWIKYGVDFIREDGKWRIWHLTAYGLFHSDYYTSWGDKSEQALRKGPPQSSGKDPAAPKGGGGPGPNARRGPERDDWTYYKTRRPKLEPVPPESYGTWDDVEGEGYLHL